MKHVIVFSYVFTILIAVSALTIQWLSGKGDKQKSFALMQPFIAVLLVMNVFDFMIYYFSNITQYTVSNLMISVGDGIIAVLVMLWTKVCAYISGEQNQNGLVKIVEKYVIVYVIVWISAVLLFREMIWLRLVIDIPLMILLVVSSVDSIRRSIQKKEKVKILWYKIIVTVFMTVNYTSYFLNEAGLLGENGYKLLDFTVFFWLVINAANMFLLYKRDFYYSFIAESQKSAPAGLDLSEALEAVRLKYELTKREIEILEEVYAGKTNVQIAETLFISESTVKAHIYNLFRKLGVKSRVEAVCIVREEKEGKR